MCYNVDHIFRRACEYAMTQGVEASLMRAVTLKDPVVENTRASNVAPALALAWDFRPVASKFGEESDSGGAEQVLPGSDRCRTSRTGLLAEIPTIFVGGSHARLGQRSNDDQSLLLHLQGETSKFETTTSVANIHARFIEMVVLVDYATLVSEHAGAIRANSGDEGSHKPNLSSSPR